MKALVAAFAFLTRLPVWRGPLKDEDLGRSVSFFPLVGLVLGFALTGVAAALTGSVAPWLVAVLLATLARRRAHVVIVSNEVGLGLVPETALGRLFRDLTGRAHQQIAAVADELYLAAMGVLLRLRPGPVEVVTTP